MIYFYAGLGAAMLTGIMLLYEVGIALTGHSLVEERLDLDAYEDVVNSADQLFQRMLTEPLDLQAIGKGRYGASLCQQIVCRIRGKGCSYGNEMRPLYSSLRSYSTPNSALPIGVWSSSCALERQLDKDGVVHRLLIRPEGQGFDFGYGLYSCIVEKDGVDQRCLFEHGA